MKIIKWEYKITGMDKVSTTHVIQLHLTQMGDDGWELCHVKMPGHMGVAPSKNDPYRFIWKRPLQMIERGLE